MKVFLAFLVLVTVIQLCATNVLSKRGIQEGLLSDGTENGIQNGSMTKPGSLEVISNGNDVIIVTPGRLDVILDGSELVFEVCSMKCFANFLICYKADSPGQNVIELCDSKSGFYVATRNDKISITKSIMDGDDGKGKGKKEECESCLMVAGLIIFGLSCIASIKNGMVKLNIANAPSECPVFIKNAIIKSDPTTTVPTILEQLGVTSSNHGNGSNYATTDDESESFVDNFWGIFLILGILLVLEFIPIFDVNQRIEGTLLLHHENFCISKSPIVFQPSTETQHRTNKSAAKPNSLYQQSSILSHKSLMWSKKEEGNKSAEETDLTSMKPTA